MNEGVRSLLVTSLQAERVLIYTQIASFVILIVDYLETLHLEVRYMWPFKWNLVNALYLILRYVPILHFTGAWPVILGVDAPWSSCPPFFVFNTAVVQFITACAAAIIFIRVNAIGNRSRKLRLYLLAHYLLSTSGIVTLLLVYYTTVDYAESALSQHLGCASLTGDGLYLTILYGVVLFNEAVMMLLTVAIGLREYLHARRTPLWQIFYRQGTLYFVALAGISMGNMTVNVWAQRPYAYTLTSVQYAFHSIFTVRMILSIRQAVNRATEVHHDSLQLLEVSIPLSEIAFHKAGPSKTAVSTSV